MSGKIAARDLCRMAPVIPVIVVEDVDHAAPLAKALVRGGLKVLEVTLRTDAALDAIRAMVDAAPDAVVGAGTLLGAADVGKAVAAGAKFGVSPGSTQSLLDAARAADLPMLPGSATPSEMMRLAEQGFDTLKFFPAEPAGGVPMLKSIAGPLPQLAFCPTGGITLEKAKAYLALPNVLCVGGSWVVPGDAIARGDWGEIERLAAEAAALAP